MPIVIRELVIRTIITDGGEHAEDGAEARGRAGGAPPPVDMVGLVEECVTRVMERLREQNER